MQAYDVLVEWFVDAGMRMHYGMTTKLVDKHEARHQ